MRLTQKDVAKLTLPEGKVDHFVWDSTLAGFGYRMRLGADGKTINRTWIAQFRIDGASRRMVLGKAEVIGAEEARKRARQALGKAANDIDPQADKRKRRERKLTFSAAVTQYLALIEGEVRASSLNEKRRYLTDWYFEKLHNKPLDQIKRSDVASALNDITLKGKKTVTAAARAQIGALFTWALTQGMVENNPVIGTRKPEGSAPKERVLSAAELAAIWKASGDDAHGKIIRLLILSACRRQEIGSMQWNELDFENGTFTLPAARSKSRRSHTLPLLPDMLDIIKRVPRMAGTDYLFGRRGFTMWSRYKLELDARSGVKKFTTHDLRRTAATIMADDLGVLPHVVEATLNHASGDKTAITYNKAKYFKEVRTALVTWHEHIRSITEGTARKVINLQENAA